MNFIPKLFASMAWWGFWGIFIVVKVDKLLERWDSNLSRHNKKLWMETVSNVPSSLVRYSTLNQHLVGTIFCLILTFHCDISINMLHDGGPMEEFEFLCTDIADWQVPRCVKSVFIIKLNQSDGLHVRTSMPYACSTWPRYTSRHPPFPVINEKPREESSWDCTIKALVL